MKNTVNNIVKNLFQKMNISELSQESLDHFKSSYPYSAIGYLLSARLKKEMGQSFEDDASRAALFINNPLWLHALLNEQYTSDTNPFIIPVSKTSTPVIVPIQKTNNLQEIPSQPLESNSSNTAPVIEEVTQVKEVSTPEVLVSLNEDPQSVYTEDTTIKQLAPEIGTVSTATSTDIIFEPYHTIDYFASQGIKLKLDDLNDDQFSRQLKSFTEWLRTMKRISPVQETTAVSKEEEPLLVQESNKVEETDIATEAMAEVWLKQGQKNRALAIYHKLSLQNPSKSHYFASKIEKLKD